MQITVLSYNMFWASKDDSSALFCSFVVPENLYKSKDSENSCELNLQQTLQLGAR